MVTALTWGMSSIQRERAKEKGRGSKGRKGTGINFVRSPIHPHELTIHDLGLLLVGGYIITNVPGAVTLKLPTVPYFISPSIALGAYLPCPALSYPILLCPALSCIVVSSVPTRLNLARSVARFVSRHRPFNLLHWVLALPCLVGISAYLVARSYLFRRLSPGPVTASPIPAALPIPASV